MSYRISRKIKILVSILYILILLTFRQNFSILEIDRNVYSRDQSISLLIFIRFISICLANWPTFQTQRNLPRFIDQRKRERERIRF